MWIKRFESIPYRREPYRRVPLGRVSLDERRLDEVHSSATLGSCLCKGHRYVFHKDAKLLRQCVLFWPRNRLSMERMTPHAEA